MLTPLNLGDGGKVILWADDVTKFHGSISATGGLVFRKRWFCRNVGQAITLEVAWRSVDVSASQGSGGMWLLDPRDVTITSSASNAGAFGGGEPDTWTPSGASSNVLGNTIVSALGGGTDVTITTNGAGGENGDITVSTFLAPTMNVEDATLTFTADGGVDVNSMINASGTNKLNIVINAGGAVTIDSFTHTNLGTFTSTGTTFQNTAQISTRGGAIDLSGHSGAVTFDSTVSTKPDSGTGASFTSGGTNLSINSKLDTAGGPIQINNTGAIVIAAAVDASGASSGSLTIADAATSIDLSANVTAGSGATINFGDNPVSLGTGVTIETTGSGAIAFGGTLDGDAGSDTLTINSGTGTIDFTGKVGNTQGVGGITINSTSGNITFAETIDDTNSRGTQLNLNAGTGTLTFTGAVGAAPLTSLTIDAGAVDFDNTLAVAGSIDVDTGTASFDNTITTTGGGTVTISNSGTLTIAGAADMTLDGAFLQDGAGGVSSAGDITTTGDSIGFNGALTLTGDQSLNTTSSAAAGANVSFNSTVTGAQSLTVNSGAGGTAAFSNAVGATPLTGLTIDAGATNFLNTLAVVGNVDIDTVTGRFDNTVQTTGGGSVTVTNSGGLTIYAAADMTLDGLFNQDGSGAVSTAGDITTSGDNVSFSGPLTLTGNVALETTSGSASGANITIGSSLDGANTLTVDGGTGGNVQFSNVVGTISQISGISITNANDVTFSNTLDASGAIAQTAGTGTTTFTGAASAGSYDVTATTGIVTSSTLDCYWWRKYLTRFRRTQFWWRRQQHYWYGNSHPQASHGCSYSGNR